jgi:hypothetical protein
MVKVKVVLEKETWYEPIVIVGSHVEIFLARKP